MNENSINVFEIEHKKYVEEAEKIALNRAYIQEKQHREQIYKNIQQECKFIHKFVKKAQSRQTGEKTVFYDIDIIKMPPVNIYDDQYFNNYNKWNKIRGRSKILSLYAMYKQEFTRDAYIKFYYIPGIEYAYEEYCKEHFFGKDIDFEGEKCKAFQIDWFDEVYVSKEKILSSFQKRLKEIKEQYRELPDYKEWNIPEPKSWERAWIDFIDYNSCQRFYNFCTDLIRSSQNYGGIKDWKEYIHEAEKILGRKLLRE